MGRTPSMWLVAASLALAGGCAGTGMPNWQDPGPLEYQRMSAQRFDPYPDNDVGPPVVGGRPSDYAEPIAEPSRARWDPRTWAARFGW